METHERILPYRMWTAEFVTFFMFPSSMGFISLDVLLLGTLPTLAIKWELMHWSLGFDWHDILMGIASVAIASLTFYGNEKQARERYKSIFAAKELSEVAEIILTSVRSAT